MTTADVCASIVKATPEIATISVETYSSPPDVTARVRGGPKLKAAIRDAIEPRSPFHFWDRFLYAAVEHGVPSQEVISFVEFRNVPDSRAMSVTRRAVLDGYLPVLAERKTPDLLNVLSRVGLKTGSAAHFAMLDFSGAPTSRLQSLVVRVAAHLLPEGGFLLHSGRSFHLLGRTLISARRRRRLYSDSLFYSPLVDRMYVAHQLRRRVSSLRISSSPPDHSAPHVVALF